MNEHQQHPIAAEAHLTAEQDAESDAKKIRWFFIGFFGNIVGGPYCFYLRTNATSLTAA